MTDRVVARARAHDFPDRIPVDGVMHRVAAPVLDLALRPGGSRARQLRYGERFVVYETNGDQVFGGLEDGAYHGWVATAGLVPADGMPSHSVAARLTHAYTAPDFKAPERMALPMGARLTARATEGRFTETEAGWVPTRHLSDGPAADPVTVAEAYLGTPYLWGGDSTLGVDCSGLVAAALADCGHAAPRDSDLQAAGLGTTLAPGTPPRRGDLLFWKGHVAWVADTDTLLHANVHHMAVTFEPLDAAIARIAAQGDGPVTRHARPGP